MSTRCGDLDPAIVMKLLSLYSGDMDRIEDVLNRRSGVLGLSGASADIRDILGNWDAATSRDDPFQKTLQIYLWRIRKYLGAYLTLAGPVQAIIFTDTIGESVSLVRSIVCANQNYFGVCIADMPERECHYALDVKSLGMPNLRRYGYHGLFHEAACAMARDHAYEQGFHFPERCLSICLENRPEIVAVDGIQPVMVSSGTTPLEGLPGQTTAGELDAGIVLKLVRKKKWGPEQINHALTMESGLSGIAGRPVRLDEVLESDDPSLRLARDVFRHRLLSACGSGIAVLGGLDAIIFSGRYAPSAHCLGPWLQERLKRAYQGTSELESHEYTLSHGIDRILADQIRWLPLPKS